MSEYDSNNHKFISFLQNSNYEEFKELLYGSSDQNIQKACSILKAYVNCNERKTKHKEITSLKNNDYGNYNYNKNIRNARQLYQEKTKHPNFDGLQRISTCLTTKPLNVAKTDQGKLRNRREQPSQPEIAVEETGLWAHSKSPQVQNNFFDFKQRLSFPEISNGNKTSTTLYDVNSHRPRTTAESLGGSPKLSECDKRVRRQRLSDSSDDMNRKCARTGQQELQSNLSELQSSINLPLKTYSTIGSESVFECVTDSFEQPESPILSRYNFSGFDRPFEQPSQSDSSDEMYGIWAQTAPFELQNNIAELESSINLPLRSYRTIDSKSGLENIHNTFNQPESPLVSRPYFSGEYKTPKYYGSDVFQDDDLLPIDNSCQERPTEIDFIHDVSPPTTLKCDTTNWDKKRKKKEQHNIVERRRRFYINDRIKELGTLLPSETDRKHKVSVLQASAEYIKKLKKDRERLEQLEEKIKQSELHYKKLMLRIQKLERTKKCIKLKKSL